MERNEAYQGEHEDRVNEYATADRAAALIDAANAAKNAATRKLGSGCIAHGQDINPQCDTCDQALRNAPVDRAGAYLFKGHVAHPLAVLMNMRGVDGWQRVVVRCAALESYGMCYIAVFDKDGDLLGYM